MAPGDFQSALRHLRDLPSYSWVFSVGITGDTAIFVSRILSSLLREGLITPGACAWLAEYSSQDTLAYTSFFQSSQKFRSRFSAIWKGRKYKVIVEASLKPGMYMIVEPSALTD